MGDGRAVARLAASEGERPFSAVCGAERNRAALRWRATVWSPEGLPFGAGLGRREVQRRNKTAEMSNHSRRASVVGQSSSGSITVIAGCASSMSRGPHVATNLIKVARRLSLRT